MRGRGLRTLAACAIVAASVTGSIASEWPERPVTVIVPFQAGGNTDTMARMGSDWLSRRLGQSFIVDNRPTAGGAIGAAAVAQSKPDGYTLLFGAASQLLVTPLVQKVPYDPDKDLVPISNVGTGGFVLAIKSSLPVKTLPEFIAYAKARPGKLNYATGGTQTLSHLSGALFVARAGLDIVQITYKGGPPAVAALLGGEVDFYFGNASEILPLDGNDRVRLLAVSTEKRIAQYPQLPAVSETLPGFALSSWNGFMVPAATPQAVIDRIGAEIKAFTSQPETQKRLTELGIIPGGMTPAETAAMFKADKPYYVEAVRDAKF